MKAFLRWLLVAAVLALGWRAWVALHPPPESIIEKRLAELAQWVSFSPGEGNFKRLANVERIESLCAENIQVTVELPRGGSHVFERRDELGQAVLQSRSFANGVKVSFIDMDVELASDHQAATVDATLQASLGAQSEPIIQPLQFSFQKTNGDWLITRIATVKTLR